MTGRRVRWRRLVWRLVVVAFLLALAGALGMALADQDWTGVAAAVRQRDPGQIGLLFGGALLSLAIGLLLGLVSWAAILRDLGPPVSRARIVRIFFVYFLTKYLSWKGLGLVATARVAKTSGVTLGRLVSVLTLSLLVVALTGLTVGLLAGVYLLGAQVGWLVLAAALTAVLVIRPDLVNRGFQLVLRLVRRPAPAHSASPAGVRLAVAAQTLSWLVSGLHLWLLAVGMGAPPARSLALCVGAFSLATVVGLLAVVIPDGIGVREAVLTAALATVLPVPAAAVVALASRLVVTVAEVTVGSVALAVAEVAHRRTRTAGRIEEDRRDGDMAQLIGLAECEQLTARQVHDLYRRYVSRSQVSVMTSFGFGRELVESAEGAWVHMRDGSRVLDLSGGVGVLNHGHNHPRILTARQRFAQQQRMEVHKAFFSPYLAALSHNVAELLPGDLSISYFPNSGAEANEGAVKMAYKYHGGERNTILRADISFHGKTLGAGSLTGSAENHFPFPGLPNIVVYPYGDIDAVRAAVEASRRSDGSSDVYAILAEPFSASSLRRWSEPALRELRELCTAEGIILIFDEIYTGWGKTGTLFYFLRYPGLIPDILTYSKSLGGGKASISGYTAREPVFRTAYDRMADVILHSTTYYGFGEETATAIEAVNVVVEDDYPARARAIEAVLAPGLERIRKTYPDTVDRVAGVGSLHGVFLCGGPKLLSLAAKLVPGFASDRQFGTKLITLSVIAHLYREHKIMTYYSPNVENPLVVAPTLVIEPAELEYFLGALEATLALGLRRLLTSFVREKVGAAW